MVYDLFVRDNSADSWPIEPTGTIYASDREAFQKTNWLLGWTKFKYVQRNDDATNSGSNQSTGSDSHTQPIRA